MAALARKVEEANLRLVDGSTGGETDSAPVPHPATSRLTALLKFEAQLRDAASLQVLKYTLVGEANALLGADQAFLVVEARRGRFEIDAISNFARTQRNAPLIQRVTALINGEIGSKRFAPNGVADFSLDGYRRTDDPDLSALPFRDGLWVPLSHKKHGLFAGVVYLRQRAWTDAEKVVAERMAGTAVHAWRAMTGESRLRRRFSLNNWLAGVCLALIAVSFIPVPLRVLAPFEIVPASPALVTAPLEGIIEDVAVEPHQMVKAGDLLFRFESTDLANQSLLARRRLAVKRAERLRLEQSAIASHSAKPELARARAEEALALAERNHLADRLSRVDVRASRDGLAIFSDRKDWTGRPVGIGEKVMQIARPDDVEVLVELPVADDIVLQDGLPVTLFLNAAPLDALEARVSRVARTTSVTSDNQLIYRMHATLSDGEAVTGAALIGNRGIAQITSQKVSLFFFVMRKPITAARQYFGL